MKKIIIILLSILLCLLFTGCEEDKYFNEYFQYYDNMDDAIYDLYGIKEPYKTIEKGDIKVSIYKAARFNDSKTDYFYFYFIVSPVNLERIKIKSVKIETKNGSPTKNFDNFREDPHAFSYTSKDPFIYLDEIILFNLNNKSVFSPNLLDGNQAEELLNYMKITVKTNKGREVFEFSDIDFLYYSVETDISEIDPVCNGLIRLIQR